MSTAEPSQPRKRQRASDKAQEPETQVVKSGDLWLDEGNIIIRTTSTEPPPTQTLYKVHKSTLALHSSVFSSLFDGPQIALEVGSECYEGVPNMDLTDPDVDVECFLKALYFPGETQRHLAALLRTDESNEQDDPSVLQQAKPISESRPTLAEVIHLAVACDVPDLLPVAYYDASNVLDTISLLDAVNSLAQVRIAEVSVLTSAEMSKLMLGKAMIRGQMGVVLTRLNAIDDSVCERACPAKGFLRTFIGFLRAADHCDEMDDSVVCKSCKECIMDVLTKWRKEFWLQLPAFFGLEDVVSPTWGVAEKEGDDAADD
ncbi:hypothetical protein BV25DRAFT_1903503 [Artomyces pyxidatus]|uniref:Uncharacterized protein n=1 Tax=Artomyces pyxidatus TaxID=48021 RepID=A0ACB8SHZ8_9AGAM|nr:hypothetical protein BV25DRAFT_1903503 [Artomyces pyxidatus]